MSAGMDPMTGSAIEAEQEVSKALHELPDGYTVVARPAAVTIESPDLAYRYEPDFVVSDPAGRTLVVEVKTPLSMSWSNLAKFVQIDRQVRKAGAAFLVLVPGAQAGRPAAPTAEFDAVNIAYGNDEAGMVKAVIQALHEAPPPKARTP